MEDQYRKNGFNFLTVMHSGNIALRQYCDLQCYYTSKKRTVLLKANDGKLYVIGANTALFPGVVKSYYGMRIKAAYKAENCLIFDPLTPIDLFKKVKPDCLFTFII